MAEEIQYIERELGRVKQTLFRLEHRVSLVQRRMVSETEEERISRLKGELMKEYPCMRFTRRTLRLLRLVGTLPYASPSEDRRAISEAIAEKC
jgi:hypothetical protein